MAGRRGKPGRIGGPPLARAGIALADACERYFPDAFVFALTAVLLVLLAGLALGEAPAKLVTAFGDGFWVLIPFTMQMALIIVGGFVVASSPPIARLIRALASWPTTPPQAVAFVAVFAMATSLLSWGLSLVFTGLLVREISGRVARLDYRAVGAAAYLGLGSVWALGLSSSAAQMQATPSALPPALLSITGVIPLSQTIGLWQSLAMAAVLVGLSAAVAWWSCPPPEQARTAREAGIVYEPLVIERRPASTPAERLEDSPFLGVAIAALMFLYLGVQYGAGRGSRVFDLNGFNFVFLALGLLLHGRPRSFLQAVGRSVPATAGVLIQFPFYAGIFGVISNTSIATVLADLFVKVTTKGTFPIVVAVYSAILGFFIPSGGGKWVVEAPYVMAAASVWRVHLGWTVQIYNAAEALPNLLNPFWMLPLMGILNVRARDLAGYSILQLLFHAPVVLLLCWWLARTLPYVPPVLSAP